MYCESIPRMSYSIPIEHVIIFWFHLIFKSKPSWKLNTYVCDGVKLHGTVTYNPIQNRMLHIHFKQYIINDNLCRE